MADIRNRDLKFSDIRFDWVFHGYETVFEGEAAFSDIDAVVHHNGRFLFIEKKSMSKTDKVPSLPPRQLGLYKAMSKQPNTTCLFVAGDMQTSTPYYIENLNTGACYDLRSCEHPHENRNFLKDLISAWFKTNR